MIDWEAELTKRLQADGRHSPVVWTPSVVVEALGLPQSGRRRRAAKDALEKLCARGLLVRRREAHGVRARPDAPYLSELGYSEPGVVGRSRTTDGIVYEPKLGKALVERAEPHSRRER